MAGKFPESIGERDLPLLLRAACYGSRFSREGLAGVRVLLKRSPQIESRRPTFVHGCEVNHTPNHGATT